MTFKLHRFSGCVRLMLFGLVLARGATAYGADSAPPKSPNIVVILVDDIGAKELACYGNKEHRTPNLDRLAETGVKFETCFTAPVCHPTRFMIMTGQYGCHNGVLNFDGKRGGPERNDPHGEIVNHVTFGKLLKEAGYATAIAGKWQLSGEQPTYVRETGFDEYCMWAGGGAYTNTDRAAALAAGIELHSRYWHPSIVKNGKWVPTAKDDYGPDIQSDFLIDYIRRNKDHPFFIYYPIVLTHSPWEPTPDTRNSGPDKGKKSLQNFKANVEYMDKLVGKLVAELDKQGLRQNTVLFMTGDNGTGGDGKSQATELGARVPMIVNGPGIVKQRGRTMELTDTSDIFPTIVELGGGKLPPNLLVDGHSYAPFLRGASDTTRDWIFAFQADRRIYRTKRFLLEDNSPLHWGHLFDCGDHRDGTGYKEVTNSTDPEVVAIKDKFNALIATHPAPLLAEEGAPNDKKAPSAKKEKRKEKKKEKDPAAQ